MSDAARQVCFVDMPFQKKLDPKTGITVDFDQIYETGIKPAIEAAGLAPIRGDQEQTGGIIHTAMFARLLLSEFVIADMTTANPNVFYELGVRHTAKPSTTIPIFATIGAPPFDVNMIRAIPYDLTDGCLSKEAAAALITAIGDRIDRALRGPVAKDSPLFDLFADFPGIEMSHEVTDVFRDRVAYSDGLRNELAAARAVKPMEAAVDGIREILGRFEDPSRVERGVLVDILLSFRAVEAWTDMIALFELLPSELRESAVPRQQVALALNRRNQPGDRDRALNILAALRREQGDSAETLGILGRIHKDRYREMKDTDPFSAIGALDEAVDAYRAGFEAEPLDYYPGVNAITLLIEKGDAEAMAEVDRLAPLVTFAAHRQGGATADDYWTVATVVELMAASHDYAGAMRAAPRAASLANEAWMLKTTCGNLRLIATRRSDDPEVSTLQKIIDGLEARAASINSS